MCFKSNSPSHMLKKYLEVVIQFYITLIQAQISKFLTTCTSRASSQTAYTCITLQLAITLSSEDALTVDLVGQRALNPAPSGLPSALILSKMASHLGENFKSIDFSSVVSSVFLNLQLNWMHGHNNEQRQLMAFLHKAEWKHHFVSYKFLLSHNNTVLNSY